jgi:hypothetical protein
MDPRAQHNSDHSRRDHSDRPESDAEKLSIPKPSLPDTAGLNSEELTNLAGQLETLRTSIETFGETIATTICDPIDRCVKSTAQDFPLSREALKIGYTALQAFRQTMQQYGAITPDILPISEMIYSGVQTALEDLSEIKNTWEADKHLQNLEDLNLKVRGYLSLDTLQLTPEIQKLLSSIHNTRSDLASTPDRDIT